MGLEATCVAWQGRKRATGKARLEQDAVYFRGDWRFVLKLADIESVETLRGTLRLTTRVGVTSLELGTEAEKWALKIRYPKSLIDKLGVRPGARVSVLGVRDPAFWEQLEARTDDIGRGRLRKDSDVIVFGLAGKTELQRLSALRAKIKSNGMIWTVWAKGKKALREDDVRSYALSCGLVDVKVVSFSEILSGLKLMIPKKLR